MGLTYDGITYRSLEEQVRYDHEQVQLRKQVDVTINESLQTINTEIDGKLTKPTNPSAESAVTMLADGTVGTKPLSEIGGSGGGKLYKHYIYIIQFYNDIVYNIVFTLYSNYSSSYTYSTLPRDNKFFNGLLTGQHIGSVCIKISGNGDYPTFYIAGAVLDQGRDNAVTPINVSFNIDGDSFSDTVTEL